MKKVGIVGAATAALSAMAIVVVSEVVEAEKPKAMPRSWNKPRNVQLRAGRVRAEMPEPMTRQVRRRMERKGW